MTMAPYAPPSRLPKELDLSAAFALTRKLVASPDEDAKPQRQSLVKTLTYWLWRLRGRRRPAPTDMSLLSRLADNYEHDLTHQHERVAQLERLTKQLQTAFERQIADLRAEHERAMAELKAKQTAHPTEAEERARLAENKVELLKEALDSTRARNDGGGNDLRFRDAKRAFARLAHPDQGGRDDPERQRLFVEFWPVLEKIERGE
ncbi:MAG: hypothetical protein H7Z12_00100 [Rhodospirillaceae bacterium]|nr:hypothetical protein [Rhodospirillales bacterium]